MGRISDQQRGRVSFRLGRGCNPHIPRCTDVHSSSSPPFLPSAVTAQQLRPLPVPSLAQPLRRLARDRTGIETLPLLYHGRENRHHSANQSAYGSFQLSKANKKFADRGWIRQETEGERGRGEAKDRERERMKKSRKKNKILGKELSSAIYSAEHFPASVTAVLCKYRTGDGRFFAGNARDEK